MILAKQGQVTYWVSRYGAQDEYRLPFTIRAVNESCRYIGYQELVPFIKQADRIDPMIDFGPTTCSCSIVITSRTVVTGCIGHHLEIEPIHTRVKINLIGG